MDTQKLQYVFVFVFRVLNNLSANWEAHQTRVHSSGVAPPH